MIPGSFTCVNVINCRHSDSSEAEIFSIFLLMNITDIIIFQDLKKTQTPIMINPTPAIFFIYSGLM